MITYKYLRLVLLLMATTGGSADCPAERIQMFDKCVFTIGCVYSIKFDLPEKCKSPDISASVNLTIHNPTLTINEEVDKLALETITTFNATGYFENTNFAFLEHLPILQHLYLVNCKILIANEKPFYRLHRLETLDLADNYLSKITDILKFEGTSNMLKRASFRNNEISVIEKYAFEELHTLEELDLSDNKITEIEEDTFSNLFNLQILNLNGNNIVKLNKAFNIVLNDLRHLYLRGNELESIDVEEELGVIYHLQTLDVSDNRLTEIKPTMFWRHLIHLEGNTIVKVLMSGNNFTNVPNAIDIKFSEKFAKPVGYKFNILIEIDLSDNQINKVEYNAFQGIQKIVSLDLSVNYIQEFKLNGTDLNDIIRLNLNNNILTSLELDWFSSMTQLENLDVSYNHINNIQKTQLNAINLDNLLRFNLSNNELTSLELDCFSSMTRLEVLDVSHNQINKIEEFKLDGANLNNILHLNLSNNELIYLEFNTFSSMIRLESLDVSHNRISNFASGILKNNFYLKSINFAFNKVKEIKNFHVRSHSADFSNNELSTITVGREMRLQRLFIQSNRITDMHDIDMSQQIGLQYLQMSNNFIRHLDRSSVRLPGTLIYLDLTHNEIGTIGSGAFAGLGNLVTLHLTRNKLQLLEFGTFQGLRALKNLHLGHNDMIIFSSKMLSELKMLRVLSLNNNELVQLDYTNWIEHKIVLYVYIEGNKLSCEWLSTALNDFSNGYSKMKPMSHSISVGGNSIDGIPCTIDELGKQENECTKNVRYVMADERLLMINKKILEAITEQTYVLQKCVHHSLQHKIKY